VTGARFALLGVLAVAPGCGGTSGDPDREPAQARPPPGIVGFTHLEYADGRFDVFLSRLDPATLAPRGPPADVGEFHDAWSRSPDGRFVAVGTGGQGLGVTIFDLVRMRRARAVRTGIAAEGLAWLTARRLVAILQSNRLVVVDPVAARVISMRGLPRDQAACTSTPSGASSATVAKGLVILLHGRGGAASRLLHVTAEGGVRSAGSSRRVATPAAARQA
jgi:hypothetical protein